MLERDWDGRRAMPRDSVCTRPLPAGSLPGWDHESPSRLAWKFFGYYTKAGHALSLDFVLQAGLEVNFVPTKNVGRAEAPRCRFGSVLSSAACLAIIRCCVKAEQFARITSN